MAMDCGDGLSNGRKAGETYIDAEIGSPIRVRRSGLAFEVRGSPAQLSPLRTKRLSSTMDRDTENPLTAEQLSEKLASAEARRESAILDTKNRCADHNVNKVGKTRELRTLMEKQQAEGLKEALDEEMQKAQQKVMEFRLARLAKLRQKELRHEELLQQQNEQFEAFVRKLDEKHTDNAGNRNRILAEVVDKMREHNARVQKIHDAVFYTVDGAPQRIPIGEELMTGERDLVDAYNERDEYLRQARERLREENFNMEFEG